MEPKSWKELLKPFGEFVRKPLNHDWYICGSSGGSIRSIGGGEIDRPKLLLYKCRKCGTTATKEIGKPMIIDREELRDKTCDEVVIHDIIV